MNNKNLYILEDENDKDIINFFLYIFNEKVDWDIINKYDFINYVDSGFIEGNDDIPSGNYHCIQFDLSKIQIESLKERLKDFIQRTFKETVNNENEFINLILDLNNYFSKNKFDSKLKFIENVFSMLLFINYLFDNNLINNNFLNEHYILNNNFFGLKISDNLNFFISFRKNLKIKYEDNLSIIDHIAVDFKLLENKEINVLKMFDILKLKGIIFNDKLKELENIIRNLGLDLINRKTLIDLKDIEYYYYNNKDIPLIEVIDLKKCTQIIFKMNHSLSSTFDKEEFKITMKNILEIK